MTCLVALREVQKAQLTECFERKQVRRPARQTSRLACRHTPGRRSCSVVTGGSTTCFRSNRGCQGNVMGETYDVWEKWLGDCGRGCADIPSPVPGVGVCPSGRPLGR